MEWDIGPVFFLNCRTSAFFVGPLRMCIILPVEIQVGNG